MCKFFWGFFRKFLSAPKKLSAILFIIIAEIVLADCDVGEFFQGKVFECFCRFVIIVAARRRIFGVFFKVKTRRLCSSRQTLSSLAPTA